MKKVLFFLFAMLLGAIGLTAQNRSISGTVVDQGNKTPLAGATVTVKETGASTVTDAGGRFTVQAPTGNATVVISSVGYADQAITVGDGESNLSFSLAASQKELEAVVVTALGISRQARTLTYVTQTVKNDALTTVKTPNLLNSLNGKVSGVQINRTSGGVGGSVRITVRGDKSTTGSQPLYVIDGQPITNPTGGANVDIYSSMPDNGDILSTINPDDIESINFLKGAGATALYGSFGSNGVILITTRKGKNGISKIDYSCSLTFDKVFGAPKLQYSYLQTTAPTENTAGSADSWGAKGASQDNTKDLFQTGATWINGVSFSSGNEKSTNFFSYSNTDNKGVVPTSKFSQNNIGFRNSSKFFDNRLTLDANFMGSLQKVENRISPGIYFSPLTGTYFFPRGLDFNTYKNNYEYLSPSRYLNAQNWWNINLDKGFNGNDDQQNPFWVLNRNKITTDNKNAYASASLNYAISRHLSIQARGNYNYFLSEAHRDVYATTQGTISGTNGKVYNNRSETKTYYGDLLLLGNNDLNKDISLNYTLGTSITDNQQIVTNIENGFLSYPNIFTLSNLIFTGTNDNGRHYTILNYRSQVQSIFASAQLGLKNKFFIDLTDRHEWSSTLAFTPKNNYNYYSIGANVILSELLTMPASVSYAKVRASYATVGKGIKSNLANPQPSIDAGSIIQPTSSPVTKAGLYLQPERNTTIELGTDWGFMHDRLLFNITWYRSNIKNQFIGNIGVPAGAFSEITSGNVDFSAGNIQNTGFEATVSYKAIDRANFKWTTTLNASANKNKIVELWPAALGVDANSLFTLTGGGFNYLKEGGSFGDIYGSTFQRNDKGQILVDTAGIPSRNENKTYLGNPNPKFILGWSNNFSFKNFNLGVLVDGKFGGKVLSLTEPFLDYYGVSQRSADARDAGGVQVGNTGLADGTSWSGKTDTKAYYTKIGGRNEIDEAYLYNATAIRLRELSLGYNLLLNHKTVKSLSFSIIGSNLFFFKKDAPFDPEQVSGVNPGGVGVDVFGLPAYRSIGFNIKCGF